MSRQKEEQAKGFDKKLDTELDKKLADSYMANMEAPDLWSRIEAGLDEVDAQRNMNKTETGAFMKAQKVQSGENEGDSKVTDIRDKRNIESEKVERKENRKSTGKRNIRIVSGLVAAAVICVLVLAGTLNNNRKKAADVAQSENSMMKDEAGSDMTAENDAIAESAAESAESYMTYDSEAAQNGISESESDGKAVSDKPVVVTSSDEQGDYIPMIMVDGTLYRDTYEMVDADGVDDSNALYAQSYTDGKPASDGEVNFDRNPSKNSAYIVCDDGSLIVKVEGNWYRFEKAE